MKSQCTFALIIALAACSNLFAQSQFFQQLKDDIRQQGRQFIQQEFGGRSQQQNDGQPQAFGSSLPSESGQRSGGARQIYNPGDGGFLLPGNGSGITYQPDPRSQPGQTIYPGQSYNSNGQIIYPNNPHNGNIVYQPSNSLAAGSSTLPSKPVTSQQFILIRCPAGSNGSIRYTLTSGGRNYGYSIYAGQEQRFPVGNGWVISYQEGSEQKRYKLEGGRVYSMKQNENSQWKLYASL
ncbi:MAG: hypothetical protein AAGA30_05360 [Planctomycetota bacterium]